MVNKERADRLLVEQGLATSREKAQALILAGLVFRRERPVRKPGELVDRGDPLILIDRLPYVSRGGLKLAEALDRFKVDVSGCVAADIGSSTGGFTDCLLQRGARTVYAVDVDSRQLDWKLRRDPRVVMIEKNARDITCGDFGERPRVATMDVSFISIRKILPALKNIPSLGTLLALIKPQFEAGRRAVGKKGIVRDPEVHRQVLKEVIEGAGQEGFLPRGLIRCSTRGQKGNTEFFGYFDRALGEKGDAVQNWIKEAVNDEKG